MNPARRLDRRAILRKARRLAVKDQVRRSLLAERLEDRSLMAGDVSAYWNYVNPYDVNRDGMVAPIDAMEIINVLNSRAPRQLPQGGGSGEGSTNRMFVDVNNDGWVTPLDAMEVVNMLNHAHGEDPEVKFTVRAVRYEQQLVDPNDPSLGFIEVAIPLTTISKDQDFYVQFLAQDLRPPESGETRGVTAGYTDILYNSSLATVAVAEQQDITVTAANNQIISLTFTPDGPAADAAKDLSGTTTIPITVSATKAITANRIAAAINALALAQGKGANFVTVASIGSIYRVTYVGALNQDEPQPTVQISGTSTTAGSSVEFIKGSPTDTADNIPPADPNTTPPTPAGDGLPDAFFSAATFASYNLTDDGGNPVTLAYNVQKNASDQAVSAVTTPPAISQLQPGQDRIINELGGVAIVSGVQLGNDPVEIARFHMIATLPAGTPTATLILSQDKNHLLPEDQPLVFGIPNSPPPDGSAVPLTALVLDNPWSLLITSGPIFANSFQASTTEGTGTTINVLGNGNTGLNGTATGAVGLKAISTLSNPNAGSVAIDTKGTATTTDDAVVFTPSATNPDFNGSVTFTYTAQHIITTNPDVINTDPNSVVTATVTLAISAVNDAPSITAPTTLSNVSEGTAKAVAGVSVTDKDADDAATNAGVKVTLTATKGTLTLGGTTGLDFTGGAGDGTADATMTFRGTTAAVNAALAGLSYQPTGNLNGAASITIAVDDQGNTGAGTTPIAQAAISFTIGAVNEAPINKLNNATIATSTHIVAAPRTTAGDPATKFSTAGSTFTVTDADLAETSGAQLTVTLTLSPATPGDDLGTIHIDGKTDGTTITITGNEAAIATQLATLTYSPPVGSTKAANLRIQSSDGGATGTPGAQTDDDTVIIDLDPGFRPGPIGDSFEVSEGDTTPVFFNVMGNDFTREKDGTTGVTTLITAVTQPARGKIEIADATGAVVTSGGGTQLKFTPPAGFAPGTDDDFFTPGSPLSFTYTLEDGGFQGDVARSATVSVNVKNKADIVTTPDNYGTTVNTGLPLDNARNVLSNDNVTKDNTTEVPDFASLSVLIDATHPQTIPTTGGGSVTFELVSGSTSKGTGRFTYTPASGFLNDDFFNYVARETDKNGVTSDSAPVQVKIRVSSPPLGKNDHYDVLEQSVSTQTQTSVLLDHGNGADTDPTEGRPLSAEIVNNINLTGAGTVNFRSDGTFDYIPDAAANFNTDREPKPDIFFTYRVVAGAGTANEAKSAPVTVSLTVKEVNDNPSANPVGPTIVIKQNAAGTIGLRQTVNIPPTAISIAPDVKETLKITAVKGTGAAITADPVTGNTATKADTTLGGKVYLENFQIKYDAPQATGADSFTYTVSDFDQTTGVARGGSASALVTLDVKDFIPKQVSGTVFADTGVMVNGTLVGAGDGVQQAGEQPMAGVTVRLDGRDVTSSTTENVHLIAVTDVNGKYVFPDPAHDTGITADYVLKPPAVGTSYRLSEDQPAFILEGTDKGPTNVLDTNTDASQGHVGAIVTNSAPKDSFFSLAWSLTDTSNFNAALGLSVLSGLNFGEGGMDLRTPSQGGIMTDSSGIKQEYVFPGQNGYVFALQTGATDTILWSKKLDPNGNAWNGYTDLSADLHNVIDSETGDLVPELTFKARDAQGVLRTAILRLDKNIPSSIACFRILAVGTEGRYIIRVDGSAFGSTVDQPYDGMFGPQVTVAPNAHGEGEAPVNQQYAGAADAVFTEKSWA